MHQGGGLAEAEKVASTAEIKDFVRSCQRVNCVHLQFPICGLIDLSDMDSQGASMIVGTESSV